MNGHAPDNGVDGLARRLAERLEREPDVLVAYLFGSRARGTARSGSDVDVAVLLRDDDGAPLRGSSELVHRRQLELIDTVADVVGSERADVVMLNEAPIALAFRVIRDGIVLVSRDDVARVRHKVHVIDRYIDMAPMRRTLEEGLRHRLEEGRFGRR